MDAGGPLSVQPAVPPPASDRERPGWSLRPLTTPDDFEQSVALQRSVWGDNFTDLVPPAILRVVQYVGGIAAGAFTEHGELAGFVFGVSGIRDGCLSHWSDTLAVRAEHRDRGLGESLKRFQRDQLLPLGIERMYWTFDPLESRNAHLNFNRLGASAGEYVRDFYTDTGSSLHEHIGTDRLVVEWEIGSPRVAALLDDSSPRQAPTRHDLRDVPRVNEMIEGTGEAGSSEPDLDLDSPRVRLVIPADIQLLKTRSPGIALEWRRVTRLAFETYFARGYQARGLLRDGAWSEYLLERNDRS